MTEENQAQIAVHWHEEKYYPPREAFRAQANLSDPNVYERFDLSHFPDCFTEYADLLDWVKPWGTLFDASKPPFWRWFVGGKLNASYNCIDRHLPKYQNKVAYYFVGEREEEPIEALTYRELYARVNELAALLRDRGVKRGDRVTIHLPMVMELPIAMMACARLGAMHSVVFGGFSGQACADRMVDSESTILLTMDGYYRNGKWLDHKEKADIAVKHAGSLGQKVEQVLVFERHHGHYGSVTPLVEGRDVLVSALIGGYRNARVEPEPMPAEDPLFLMYTSGSTGKPKGIQHGTGGYLSYVAATSKNILDIKPDDVYWCMADIGWITGHSYIVYGPLALGATSVLYEGGPTYPDAGRPWRIAERLGVNIFHTSPTAIRSLRQFGDAVPGGYQYQFKLMATVGEPIEPDVWRWYYNVVGKGQAAIVDTWWQTETGGFMVSTAPALQDMKPGSAGPGVPGIHPVILDDEGHEVAAGSGVGGNLCIRNPWPGVMQTIWRDPERFVKTYYGKYNRRPESHDWRDWPYLAGDGAMEAGDGYFRILGRIDDVINVAGHRLGTKELESAVLSLDEVSEAAVVAAVDDVKGTVPEIYVVIHPGVFASEALSQKIMAAIVREIGAIARPRKVWMVPDLPKTRSGKIMRRILASISNNQETGDVTTLANPEIVETIRQMVRP